MLKSIRKEDLITYPQEFMDKWQRVIAQCLQLQKPQITSKISSQEGNRLERQMMGIE